MTPLHQISLPVIIVCAVFVFAALALIQRWALQRLNSEPAEDMDSATADKDAEILGDVPLRSTVGTPRARRLQPPGGEEEPALSPLGGGPTPAGSLAITGATAFAKPATPPADKSRESVALPPLSVGLAPLGGSVGPTVEKVADGVVAVGQPVSLANAPAGPQTPTSEIDDDDVKKRKSSSASAGAKPDSPTPGLIIIPKGGSVAAETVKSAETPVPPKAEDLAPAAPPPAVPASEPKPDPAAKITGRPRIFLPANLPAPAAAKPGEEPALAAAKPEAKPDGKPEIPAGVATLVTEVKADLKPEPKPEEKPAEPVTPVVEPAPVKAETPAEPAKPEAPAVGGGWLRGLLRRADADEPAKSQPAEPVTAKAEEKPAPVPAPVAEVKPDVAAAAEKLAETPATPPIAAPVVPPPAPAAEIKPAPIEPIPAAKPIPVAQPSPVAKTPAAPVSTPQPTMAQNEPTTTVPADARASAQLTLGFEVASLQLTPFFKLGGVQLKPLSKVVGLHLIASQAADTPLAAGISFEIDKVEVNEASHIKSILLKPLGESRDAATPQTNLKVDAIQIGQGTEGAPISVTSSGAAVQLLATFVIAAMEFTPAFEIGSLRLEPTSNSVLLRLSPSSKPTSLELPPAFEVANVALGEDGQITTLRLTPGSKPA